MSEATLPETWADARKVILTNSPWILLLVTFERVFEGHYYQAAVALLLCGVVLGIAIHGKAFEGIGKPEGRRRLAFILIAVGAVCLAAGTYLLAAKAPQSDAPNVPTVDETAKAIAPIVAKRDAAVAQRDAAIRDLANARQQIATTRQASYAKKMGPINTLNAFSAAGRIWRELIPQEIAILFTASSENSELWGDLKRIFEVGLREVQNQITPGRSPLLQPPNHERDIDAPRLTSTELSGIIIHGPIPDSVRHFFENCFVTRLTEKVPVGLSDYYKFKQVIWIEIGPGFPWKNPEVCAE
jgi:hypothetical protein